MVNAGQRWQFGYLRTLRKRILLMNGLISFSMIRTDLPCSWYCIPLSVPAFRSHKSTQDSLSVHGGLSSNGILLVDTCLEKSPGIVPQFVSLGLITSLERVMKFHVSSLSPRALRSLASCIIHGLRAVDNSLSSLNSVLHLVVLLARYQVRRYRFVGDC